MIYKVSKTRSITLKVLKSFNQVSHDQLLGAFVFFPGILAIFMFLIISWVSTILNHLRRNVEKWLTTFLKVKNYIPTNDSQQCFVVRCMCRELKSGAMLRTEFTAIMTNDIAEDYFDELANIYWWLYHMIHRFIIATL